VEGGGGAGCSCDRDAGDDGGGFVGVVGTGRCGGSGGAYVGEGVPGGQGVGVPYCGYLPEKFFGKIWD